MQSIKNWKVKRKTKKNQKMLLSSLSFNRERQHQNKNLSRIEYNTER